MLACLFLASLESLRRYSEAWSNAGGIRSLVIVLVRLRHPFCYCPSILWCMFWSATNNGGSRRVVCRNWRTAPRLCCILPEVRVDLATMNSAITCISIPERAEEVRSRERRAQQGKVRPGRRTHGTPGRIGDGFRRLAAGNGKGNELCPIRLK